MRQRRPRTNWFLIFLVLILIVIVTYVDRFILPTAQVPGLPTATATRDPESYITEAQGLFDQGKLSQAIDTYLEAIRIKPDDPATYIALARVQIFAGRYADALTNAENALLLSPNNSMANAIRGWALTNQGNYSQADDSLKTALRLDQNNGQAHAYDAFLYGAMYENGTGPYVDPIQTAIAESQIAINLAPNSLEAHWARAYILQITSNYEQAVTEYQNAIKINKNISEIHLQLGETYKALSLVDETNINTALQEYSQANTLNPSDYRPAEYSSRALAYIGDYAKAVQFAEQAVKNSPTDPYLRGNWGYMLYKNFEWPAALQQFDLAVNGGQSEDGQTILPLNPTSNSDTWVSKYFYAYAILLAQSNRCADALPLTQKILDYFRSDQFAAQNVDYALSFCTPGQGTPVAQPSKTPVASPTP
ncbi:MAG TPA: tetratricopeptide repeat protein [Anaerolineales bacterium]|nr:tetratricopeptide repeat protein [Anaerolineales bacterium]